MSPALRTFGRLAPMRLVLAGCGGRACKRFGVLGVRGPEGQVFVPGVEFSILRPEAMRTGAKRPRRRRGLCPGAWVDELLGCDRLDGREAPAVAVIGELHPAADFGE